MYLQNYSPGQKVTLFIETVDGYGIRADNPTPPTVDRIIFPNLSLADGMPQSTVKLDIGLYYYHFNLPTGAESVGTYFIDISYINPDGYPNIQSYQILVNAPFGLFNVTT